MKRVVALLLCLILLLSLSACGIDTPQNDTSTTTTPTTLDDALDYIDQHTTTTQNPDGSTTITLTSDTTSPAIPTKATKPLSTVKRKTTTTKKRTTTTDDGRPTVVITQPATTTTQKPAPVPTMPPTTTTTTAATKPGATTAPTTTEKKFDYAYTVNQEHMWLPLEERYYYSLMNDEWKSYYRMLDEAVRHLDASVYFPADITKDGKQRLYFIYMMDTPELFFLSKTVTIYHRGDGTSGFRFSYSVGRGAGEFCGYGYALPEINDALREKIRQKKEKFDDAVYAITNTIPANAPAVVKERMIYDAILKSSAYNLPAAMGNQSAVGGAWDGLASDNWTAYGILVNHTGVCESYSEAFQTLCNAVGINCTGIEGSAGGGHKWNAVKLDGEWYQCDITFDDPIGSDPDDAHHTYFNLTDARMRELTHVWSKTCWEDYFADLKYPVCTATKYSWENFCTLYGK